MNDEKNDYYHCHEDHPAAVMAMQEKTSRKTDTGASLMPRPVFFYTSTEDEYNGCRVYGRIL